MESTCVYPRQACKDFIRYNYLILFHHEIRWHQLLVFLINNDNKILYYKNKLIVVTRCKFDSHTFCMACLYIEDSAVRIICECISMCNTYTTRFKMLTPKGQLSSKHHLGNVCTWPHQENWINNYNYTLNLIMLCTQRAVSVKDTTISVLVSV